MSVRERDPLTGHQTTGHEWNGITELNTRVPRAVWFFIIVTMAWSFLIWIMMPAWPLIWTYTGGLLGIDQKRQVEQAVQEGRESRAAWSQRIEQASLADIRADPQLMKVVRETGPRLFGDNCASCHRTSAMGGPGFPNLIDDDWLWGGGDDQILETIRVGVNAPHPETRTSQMLAFGRDGVLTYNQVRSVAAYVKALSGGLPLAEVPADGAEIFVENCASCHGADGHGNPELGAPNLTDNHWLYGGDMDTIVKTIFYGQQGWMPAWEHRLSIVDRKILAAYILDLGKEKQQ